jgi:hypothetical protein
MPAGGAGMLLAPPIRVPSAAAQPGDSPRSPIARAHI